MNRQSQVNVDSLSDTVHKLCQPKAALLVNVHMHWTKVDVHIWTWNCGRKKRRRGEGGDGGRGKAWERESREEEKEKGGSERHTKDCIVYTSARICILVCYQKFTIPTGEELTEEFVSTLSWVVVHGYANLECGIMNVLWNTECLLVRGDDG